MKKIEPIHEILVLMIYVTSEWRDKPGQMLSLLKDYAETQQFGCKKYEGRRCSLKP